MIQPNSDPDTAQLIRRSERVRQPPRRLDYPELGHPIVTVVKSFFQGLSTASAESMNADDRWLKSQAFEMSTPIIE